MKYLILNIFMFISTHALGATVHEIKAIALEAANHHEIKYELVLAVILTESSFNPNALGGTHGEVGLLQLHPKYFPEANFDVRDNIFLGVSYMARLKKHFKPRYGDCWIVAYNVGYIPLKYPCKHSYYKRIASNLNYVNTVLL